MASTVITTYLVSYCRNPYSCNFICTYLSYKCIRTAVYARRYKLLFVCYITVTVITQPDNTTTCKGGAAVFTCIMDIRNVSISIEDIRWWRKREDNNMTITLSPNLKRYNITNIINEHKLTSFLVITDVRLVDFGPYWLGLTVKEERLCNNAFLSIVVVPNGMYLCILYVYVCIYK